MLILVLLTVVGRIFLMLSYPMLILRMQILEWLLLSVRIYLKLNLKVLI